MALPAEPRRLPDRRAAPDTPSPPAARNTANTANTADAADTRSPPARTPNPLATPGAGAPDAGARVGYDVATPPSLPASAPRLNLDLVRPRGGAISAQGGRGLLQMLPHPPEAKTKLAEDIEKAARADCRKAHGSLGLAAVVPLVADALSDKGCRW